MMTVHEVSKLAGVSIRTLQYYDKIGLLHPTGYTDAGYRLYDDTDLERLQHILLFRELEFPLKDIRDILNSPGFDRSRALEQQIELLRLKKEHIENLMNFALGIKMMGVKHMDFKAFDRSKLDEYSRQAKELYGNTPYAMAKAAMEWLDMCADASFFNVVVSLKASNTVVMVQAYRELVKLMKERKLMFPLHLGVTEAGNGDAGRIKSCVGIASLLREGIGDTIRVSLTEPPVKEIPVARHIVDYFSRPEGFEPDPMLDAAILWGPRLLDREIDAIPPDAGLSPYLEDEIMQASRRRFYRPEYIACPGCGRTMYRLEETFEEVKRRTAHLKGMVIAVMGCIVNGPGEMADADWGYVGEGGGKVSIYHNGQRALAHIPDNEAIDKLLELIEES